MKLKFKDCFTIDAHLYNVVPKSTIKKVYLLLFSQRYSMTVLLRLTEASFSVNQNSKVMFLIASFFKRLNEVLNQFEHNYEHDIAFGTVFHHTGVTIPSKTVIKKNCQIFKNVTFGLKNGRYCICSLP
jgi:serine acetyltransferase